MSVAADTVIATQYTATAVSQVGHVTSHATRANSYVAKNGTSDITALFTRQTPTSALQVTNHRPLSVHTN